jgi:hypothetical protein
MASFNPANVITDPDVLSASVKAIGPVAVSTISRTTNVVTIDTGSNPHYLVSGQYIIVADMTTTSFNGTFGPITVVDANTLTYSQTDSDESGTVGSGTVVATLNPDDDVFIDATTTPKYIQLNIDTNTALDENGVTLKAMYSFLKDRWKADDRLIKFPFPMTPITDEQFEFYNGWNLDPTTASGGSASQVTTELIRTGGWAVKNANGVDTERWASIISLGTLGALDQAYYLQQNLISTDATENFVLSGQVNQAIQFYSDTNGDGTPDYDYSQFTKLFVREWEKTYANSTLEDIGVTTLTYQAYRFPLTNAADSKLEGLNRSQSAASGVAKSVQTATWSTNVATITTTAAHGFETGDVIDVAGIVSSGQPSFTYNGTFEITVTSSTQFTYSYSDGDPGTYTSGGTISGDVYNNMSISWYSLGQLETGFFSPTEAYFTVVIDANVSGTGTNPSTEEIYGFIQANLNRVVTTNINTTSVSQGTGAKIGKVVPDKLQFIGDDLYTLGQSDLFEGVYIDDYDEQDINSLHFWGYSVAVNAPKSISSIARSTDVVTVDTAVAHNLTTGDIVTITGVTGGTTSFNGTFTVTVVDSDTFTYSQTGADESGTTGANSYVISVESSVITSIARSTNVVTVDTATPHGYTTGDTVTISNVSGGTTSFNGVFEITVVDADTFTFSQVGADESGTVDSTSIVSPAEYTNIQYPFTAILTLSFGANLVNDPDAIYRVFFLNDDAGSNAGQDFGTAKAILVNKKDGSPMSGNVSGLSSVTLSYDYDGNVQRGSGSNATPAPIVAVAIGLEDAQYVVVGDDGSLFINRSITNSASLVAPLERNYQP